MTPGSLQELSAVQAFATLRADHERVEVLLHQLRSAADPMSLVSVLDELDKTLVAHFAHEENPGGLYEVLGLRQEKYRTPAGNLLEEHYDLLAGLRELAAQAREP